MAVTRYSVRRPIHRSWSDFDDMSNRLSRLFNDSVPAPASEGRWIPPVSVSETGNEILLTAELPGLTEDDLSIELEDNVLTIGGEKSEMRREEDEERTYHVLERSYGSFSRAFTLPRTVDGAGIVATFEQGVLTVKLPKVAEAKGRKIEIQK